MKLQFTGYFDGSCNPNPSGELGVGAVVYLADVNKVTAEIWSYSKMYPASRSNTNNVAEYMGLIALLDYFIEKEWTHEDILIRGDSQLVISQMRGEYRIKSGKYKPKAIEAKNKAKLFTNLRFYWCPREGNKRADYLSNPSQK